MGPNSCAQNISFSQVWKQSAGNIDLSGPTCRASATSRGDEQCCRKRPRSLPCDRRDSERREGSRRTRRPVCNAALTSSWSLGSRSRQVGGRRRCRDGVEVRHGDLRPARRHLSWLHLGRPQMPPSRARRAGQFRDRTGDPVERTGVAAGGSRPGRGGRGQPGCRRPRRPRRVFTRRATWGCAPCALVGPRAREP